MIFEIIVIIILAISAVFAIILMSFNLQALKEARSELDTYKTENNVLNQCYDNLFRENAELENQLEAERKNSKELRKIIIDYEIAANSQQEEPEPAAVKEEKILQANAKERLPEGHTNVISGMPYTTITDKKSEQWALQLRAYTGKYGIRSYFDGDRIYFLAAMGSAYGRTIGDTFRVTLRCGTVLYVMLAEFKDDGTDPNFFGHKTTHADGYDVTCVLEFIYDAANINSKALQAGNFCNIECFGGLHGYGGDIVKIEYLGRRWEP